MVARKGILANRSKDLYHARQWEGHKCPQNDTGWRVVVIRAVGGNHISKKANLATQMEKWDELIRAKEWDAAREAAEQLRRCHPNDPGVLNNWAIVAAHDGRDHDAVGAWNQALQVDPKHMNSLTGMAVYAVQHKRWREAYEWGRRMLTVDSCSIDAKQILSTALGWMGRTHIDAAEWDKAIVVAQEILQFDPDSPTAYYLLGWAEIGQEAPAIRAEQYFRKSLSLVGIMPSTNATADLISWGLGDSLYRQERFTEALSIFRNLKRARPYDVTLQNGERNSLTGLVKQAMFKCDGTQIKSWSDELLAVDQKSTVGWNARGLYLLRHARQPRAAIPCFQHALENAKSSSDRAVCAVNVGWAWMRLHRLARADKAFRLAQQFDPHSNDVRMALQVRHMQKQYDALLAVAAVVVVLVIAFH